MFGRKERCKKTQPYGDRLIFQAILESIGKDCKDFLKTLSMRDYPSDFLFPSLRESGTVRAAFAVSTILIF
jgi:hypothetical protein